MGLAEYDPDDTEALPRHARMVHWLLESHPGQQIIRLSARQVEQIREAMAPYFECDLSQVIGMRSGPLPRRDGRWPHGGRWKVWFHTKQTPTLEVDAYPPPEKRREE